MMKIENSKGTVLWSQKVGIIIAYIICAVAIYFIIGCLISLITYGVKDIDWIDYASTLLYHILVAIFTWLCVVRWLKQGRLTTFWMLLSMLISAIIVYGLLALTCKWEPAFLRRYGMELNAPCWLGAHQQFFIDLTPESAPPFHKISLLENNVFLYALFDYPGLFLWAAVLTIGSGIWIKRTHNKRRGQR